MAPSQRYVNYPPAKEGPETTYKKLPGANPVLRGWALVLASGIITRSNLVAKYFWNNAGIGVIKDLPGLEELRYRYDPTVIPIFEQGASTQAATLGPDLNVQQPPELPGRYYSVADYHGLYRRGEVTPLQVVKALLPIIRRDQKPAGKYASAWVHSDEKRVLAAAQASTERYAAQKPLGILDGVPIGVKDDTDVEGYISHWGMAHDPNVPFFKIADKTSPPIQMLLNAGAIVVGKQVEYEIGMDTSGLNVSWGTPINWFNPAYYPGGSSSGAGSALGAGLIPISVGTDAGGSCRLPPSFNGVYGLKASHSRTGTMKSTVAVIAPMAANVTDLTVAYRLMAQPDAENPAQSCFAPSRPPEPSAKKVIGIYNDWFDDADPVVVEACRQAIDYLRSRHDYQVVDISIPYCLEGQKAHSMVCLGEARDSARKRTVNPEHMFAPITHPNRVLLAIGGQTNIVDHCKFAQLRELHMQHLAFLFKKYPGLLILTPTAPKAGWKIHPADQAYGFSDADTTLQMMRFVWLANFTGCPSAVAPVAYVDPEQGEGKLPVSLMATGEWGAEEQLLGWAGHVERYLHEKYAGGRQKPKEWADVLGKAKQAKL